LRFYNIYDIVNLVEGSWGCRWCCELFHLKLSSLKNNKKLQKLSRITMTQIHTK